LKKKALKVKSQPGKPILKEKAITGKSKTRDAILAAALKIFASEGYSGASMPRIAREADVGTPLIHYHFNSKDNLWRETVAYSLADLRQETLAINNVTASINLKDRLKILLLTITKHAAHWPDNFVMMIAEARSQSDRFKWVHQQYTEIIFNELQNILINAMQKQLIKKTNVEQLTTLLIGGILVYFTANPTAADRHNDVKATEDLNKLAEEYSNMLLDLLIIEP